jgi:phospholipase C
MHGSKAAGAPFNIYAPGMFKNEMVKAWSYAVRAGDSLRESFDLVDFENQHYHLRVYGPNGFYREFTGSNSDPAIDIAVDAYKNTLRISIRNNSQKAVSVQVKDNSYASPSFNVNAQPAKTITSFVDPAKSFGWYDVSVQIEGDKIFKQTFAGRIENGKPGKTDPLMGRVAT